MRIILLPVFLYLLAGTVFAANAEDAAARDLKDTARALMQQARRENQAYEIVQSLTTRIGPRLAGTQQEARARQWAVAELKALGFDRVYVELFDIPLWVRGVERAEIITPFPQPLTVTALGGSTATPADGLTAQVVAFESLAALQQASLEAVAGKIVFIDEAMARSRDGSGYGVAVQKRLQAAHEAQKLGALAVLIRSVGTGRHRFAHTGSMRTAGDDEAMGVPAAALAGPDADQLQRALAYGQPVTVKLVLTPQALPAAVSGNVIAEITGRAVPQEIVLVGAHLDSWDLGTGAVDDGAGVGIVLGAAKVLIDQLPDAPRRTIRVVLFGAEEVGYWGAKAYVREHAAELDQHIVAAESDFGAGAIWRFDTAVASGSLASIVATAGLLAELGIARGGNEARGGPDVRYLQRAGVPVISLMQDGSDYFDLHHTADDTFDKIPAGALNQNVAAYAAFLYMTAETTEVFR